MDRQTAEVEVLRVADLDRTLVLRAIGGDAEAQRALVERHERTVFRFLCDLLRDSESAGDATQETFARAHSQLAKVGSEVRFRAWLLGIARNVAFEIRRKATHLPIPDDDDLGVPDAVIPAPDPEKALLQEELGRHFEEALGLLSSDRRAALLMRLDHGMSYPEIASAFGWTIPTVKNEIHRARLRLRAALRPHLRG